MSSEMWYLHTNAGSAKVLPLSDCDGNLTNVLPLALYSDCRLAFKAKIEDTLRWQKRKTKLNVSTASIETTPILETSI